MTTRTPPEIGGMGHSVPRKEDPRFIRGKGNFVDDLKLPGMLHLDIVRSPMAHAPDYEHQHRESPGSPWRSRSYHRKGPGTVQPCLDAHLDGRHPDGIARGHRQVRRAGGGRCAGHRPVHRCRRRQRCRGGVRTLAGGDGSLRGLDRMPLSSGKTRKSKATTSGTGRSATVAAQTAPSARATSRSKRTSTYPVSTSHLSRRAAVWPSGTLSRKS